VIEQHVAGADLGVPPKTPSPADSASRRLGAKPPVSDNAVYQELGVQSPRKRELWFD
jgi:hypothetical protein